MKLLHILYKIFIFSLISLVIIITGLYIDAYFKDSKLISTARYILYDSSNNIININDYTTLNNVPDSLINATISIEDKNFYNHNGFDYTRIIKAMLNNIKAGKIVEGASTISQQYIKNEYLSFEKTWSRKLEEALLTINLEMHYSKDEILESYLNSINYGKGNIGITSASKYYFNKDVKDLSLEESIILAGIPKNPSNYNPVNNYEECIKRAKVVALSMLNNNYISEEEYNNLSFDNIKIYTSEDNDSSKMIDYYISAVKSELNDLNITYDDTMLIYTEMDSNMQNTLEDNIYNYIDGDDDLEVSSVIINPKNGGILALTGGYDYLKSEYNRAINSKRQVGSTMKPFLYYAALENGMTSSSTFLSKYTTFNLDNGTTYSPTNWADLYANKEITMTAAIAYSDNIYAVKTNLFLGPIKMIEAAHKAGIKESLDEIASLPLGTNEINIIDFANGYTTLASGGYQRNVHLINKITNKNGDVIYEYKESNDLVLNPNYVYILNEMLTSTTNANFKDYNTPTALGIASKLSNKYAIKTGTTDSDYWTIGYNQNILMLLWAGYDDNKALPSGLGSKCKNIFADTVESYPNKENSWYDTPRNVIGVLKDALTGEDVTDNSKANIFYYLKGSQDIN